MPPNRIGAKTMIDGPTMKWLEPSRRVEFLRSRIQDLQHELGRALVAALWNNPGHPYLIQLDAHEHFAIEQDAKILSAEATVLETTLEKVPLEYHIPVFDAPLQRIPHFRYFPADWVCSKCGCIIDGLAYPRMCSQCAAPRSPTIAMEEARAYASNPVRRL